MFIVNVEGAMYKDGQWLMITRSLKEENAGGTLSFVGGKVDKEGDTLDILERTVKREIYEEVGVKVKENVTYVYSSSFATDDGRPVINLVFLCEYDQGTPYCKSPDEVDSVQWMTLAEIMNHPQAPPWTKESAQRAEETRSKLDKY